jgi:hypothetical protein
VNLAAVMDEIGEALESIAGLRVFPYTADKVTPPAAIVDLPDKVTFDETYQRGADAFTIPVTVVVGKVSDRASRDAIAAYVAGSGPASVKSAVDGWNYTEADSVTVTGCEFAVVTFAATQYLGALFDVDVLGQGA